MGSVTTLNSTTNKTAMTNESAAAERMAEVDQELSLAEKKRRSAERELKELEKNVVESSST